MKRIVLFSLLFALHGWLSAQEMEFQITINTPQLQTADPKVFVDLKNTLQDFLNSTQWTNDPFEVEERIQCNIQMNIRDELSPTEFKADLQIQAIRPVYNSNSETVILSHNDKDIQFVYEQFQPIEYSPNTFQNNLTSIFSFYVYYILGLDYDTFSPFGGENHFQTAQDIVTTIPTGVAARNRGWRAVDGNRNRYWMIESVLNPRVRPFRQGMYDYHRLGLDTMYDDVETSKVIITQVLEEIGKVDRAYPNSMILQMFSNAKTGELVEIYKQALSSQKGVVRRVMTKIDATNAAKYRTLGR